MSIKSYRQKSIHRQCLKDCMFLYLYACTYVDTKEHTFKRTHILTMPYVSLSLSHAHIRLLITLIHSLCKMFLYNINGRSRVWYRAATCIHKLINVAMWSPRSPMRVSRFSLVKGIDDPIHQAAETKDIRRMRVQSFVHNFWCRSDNIFKAK